MDTSNVLVSSDKDSVMDFMKNMEKINNLKEIQESLTEKFREYKECKLRLKGLRKEIKDILQNSSKEKSMAEEITSEIFGE